jgi:hypothetical protein
MDSGLNPSETRVAVGRVEGSWVDVAILPA